MKVKNTLKSRLKFFIVPHPFFEKSGQKGEDKEEIYTPQKHLTIRFVIEGGFEVEGTHNKLEINYNDPELLILSVNGKTLRVSWNRIIGFELTSTSKKKDVADLMRITPERAN